MTEAAQKPAQRQPRRVVSGMRPTGRLHIGHYHGAVKTAIFEAQGAALKKIFETKLYDSTTQAQGRQLVARWKLTLGKTVPKEITVQRCIEGASQCEDPDVYEYARAGGKYLHK